MIKKWAQSKKLPKLGTISLGIKDETGRFKAVDYFVVPNEVKEVYGETPRELDIMLPSDDIETVFPAYLKRYGGQAGLICWGDGEKAYLQEEYARSALAQKEYGITFKDGKFYRGDNEIAVKKGESKWDWLEILCSHENCPLYKNGKCRERATLKVILYKVSRVLGVYHINTSSVYSYQNIMNAINLLSSMTGGRIGFIPLKLRVVPFEAHPVVEGKRIKSKIPVMTLDLEMSMENLMKMMRVSREPVKAIVGETPDVEELAELGEAQYEDEGIDIENQTEYEETNEGPDETVDGEPKEAETIEELLEDASEEGNGITFVVMRPPQQKEKDGITYAYAVCDLLEPENVANVVVYTSEPKSVVFMMGLKPGEVFSADINGGDINKRKVQVTNIRRR